MRGVLTLRGSGGRKSPSGSRAKPGRGPGGRSPPEAEAVLHFEVANYIQILIWFLEFLTSNL